VKLDLELKNVNHTYEVGGLEWKASTLVIKKINCKTEADEVKVTQANVNVDAPFVHLRIRRPSTKHNKEAKKIIIHSKLTKAIEIPLPTRMDLKLSWDNGKPIITWDNPKAIKEQFMALAKDYILASLKSSVSFSSNLPKDQEFTDGFSAYQEQLKQLLGNKVQISFDRLSILQSVLEAVLLQIAPTLQLTAKGEALALSIEVKNNSLFIYEQNKTFVPTLELKDWLARNQKALVNKVNVFLNSEVFNANLVKAMPENKLMPKYDKITLQPWVNKENKQYFDLSLEKANSKPIVIEFEAPLVGLPKVVGGKDKLDQWLIASFIDKTIQTQGNKIAENNLAFEGFSFIPSGDAYSNKGFKAQTVILIIQIK
jgi:hypothetical protein